MSSWGLSWGQSWGNSWGEVTPPAPPPPAPPEFGGGYIRATQYSRERHEEWRRKLEEARREADKVRRRAEYRDKREKAARRRALAAASERAALAIQTMERVAAVGDELMAGITLFNELMAEVARTRSLVEAAAKAAEAEAQARLIQDLAQRAQDEEDIIPLLLS